MLKNAAIRWDEPGAESDWLGDGISSSAWRQDDNDNENP